MDDSKVKELLERYDSLRLLMTRLNSNMLEIKNTYQTVQAKEQKLEDKLKSIEEQAEQVVKMIDGKNAEHQINIEEQTMVKSTSIEQDDAESIRILSKKTNTDDIPEGRGSD